MSELTKITIKIAAILLKNLSDALLTTASEISKLENHESTVELFTQADDNQPLLPPEKPKLITHYQYEPKQKVLVIFEGAQTATKCNVLKRLDSDTYLVYPQRSPKSASREIRYSQILGLDPDR
ncbi:MAG: hypothetical protein ACKPCM_12900 [Pseudanabaena sp.]